MRKDCLADLAEKYAGSEAAIESSGHYRPIYEQLDEHLDVTLVNPGKNRVIAEASVNTDRGDAKRLAQMLQADMLAESYVPSDDIRTLRDFVRTRKAVVEDRAAEKNRVRAVLKRTDNAYASALFGPTGREYLAEVSLSEADRVIVEAHPGVIEEYDAQIDRLETEIEAEVLEWKAVQLLLSIPGFGQSTAALVVAVVGEIERFDRHEELVSNAGLDPMIHQLGDKEVHGSISKEGSALLRWALVQCAHVSVRYDEYLGNFYTRLKERKNHQIAIDATARKLLVSMFYMLQGREMYDPPEVSA